MRCGFRRRWRSAKSCERERICLFVLGVQSRRPDCRRHQQKLLEGHLQLAESELAKNERVVVENFVGDRNRQNRNCGGARKLARLVQKRLLLCDRTDSGEISRQHCTHCFTLAFKFFTFTAISKSRRTPRGCCCYRE